MDLEKIVGACPILKINGGFNMSSTNEYRFSFNSNVKKGRCPKCGHIGNFRYYYDYQRQSIIDESCGKCDRVDNCEHHYTPREYFKDHPGYFDNEFNNNDNNNDKINEINDISLSLNSDDLVYLEKDELLAAHIELKNPFLIFLSKLGISDIDILRLCRTQMNVITLSREEIIFCYEDLEGRWTRGKIMKYDETGHRIKSAGSINSVHNLLEITRDLRPELHLYGLHLLNRKGNENKSIAIVESEKSAVLGNYFFPEMIWMATSGLSNLKYERLKPLSGRQIILFPDSGCSDLWRDKIDKENIRRVMDISVNDTFENPEFIKGYDIADYIVDEIMIGKK